MAEQVRAKPDRAAATGQTPGIIPTTGLGGQLKFVGFDAAEPLVVGLRDGKVDALVVQDPRRMGRIAVEHLKKLLDGEQVPPVVDTGSVLVTKANMDDPEIAPLLK